MLKCHWSSIAAVGRTGVCACASAHAGTTVATVIATAMASRPAPNPALISVSR